MSETIRGGGHVGPSRWFGYHATWPIASLTVEAESITLRMWPINYRFEKSVIICLQKKSILGWPALRIIHNNPLFSKSVVFQPIGFSNLQSILAQNGFNVTTEEPSPSLTENIPYSSAWSMIGYIAAIAGVIAAIIAGFVAKK